MFPQVCPLIRFQLIGIDHVTSRESTHLIPIRLVYDLVDLRLDRGAF
jgi:hypothetical protein